MQYVLFSFALLFVFSVWRHYRAFNDFAHNFNTVHKIQLLSFFLAIGAIGPVVQVTRVVTLHPAYVAVWCGCCSICCGLFFTVTKNLSFVRVLTLYLSIKALVLSLYAVGVIHR